MHLNGLSLNKKLTLVGPSVQYMSTSTSYVALSAKSTTIAVHNCKSAAAVCCFCSESHDGVKDCLHKGDEKSFKCANCCKANAKCGLNIDVYHSVMSLQCPVLRKKIEQKKKIIRYQS